jgi:hypothetical protein
MNVSVIRPSSLVVQLYSVCYAPTDVLHPVYVYYEEISNNLYLLSAKIFAKS